MQAICPVEDLLLDIGIAMAPWYSFEMSRPCTEAQTPARACKSYSMQDLRPISMNFAQRILVDHTTPCDIVLHILA